MPEDLAVLEERFRDSIKRVSTIPCDSIDPNTEFNCQLPVISGISVMNHLHNKQWFEILAAFNNDKEELAKKTFFFAPVPTDAGYPMYALVNDCNICSFGPYAAILAVEGGLIRPQQFWEFALNGKLRRRSGTVCGYEIESFNNK